ncbi:glycosyltransferase [Microvirga sp. 2MCAF38]
MSTEASSGGAARAMQRLATGLRARGHQVDVFVTGDVRNPAHEIKVLRRTEETPEGHFAEAGSSVFDYDYVSARRTDVSNTNFSTQIAGFDLSALSAMRGYDIINVHWTGFMMSPPTLGNLIDLGVPTFFTLHDMGHFTGGCHYSAGCPGYAGTCEPCHQVDPDELGLVRRSLAEKRARYRKPNVRAISPSAWLAHEADRSGVFAQNVQVISNGLETDIFQIRDREAARRSLELDPDTRAILFGVYDDAENRKGYKNLLGALQRCLQDPRFAELVVQGRVRFLSFGKSARDLTELGVPFINLGWVADDARLSEIYNAADLCILPSSEDNQPNVMLEAMGCGVPVIAFRTGGIPETIIDGKNGRLIEPFDLDAMAAAISELAADADLARAMGGAAAEHIAGYSLDRQARDYEDTFAAALSQTGWKSASVSGVEEGPGGARTVSVPFRLDAALDGNPIAPILCAQITILKEQLAAVSNNRDIVLEQLIATDRQLVAANEYATARTVELNLLKKIPINRWMLRLLVAMKKI